MMNAMQIRQLMRKNLTSDKMNARRKRVKIRKGSKIHQTNENQQRTMHKIRIPMMKTESHNLTKIKGKELGWREQSYKELMKGFIMTRKGENDLRNLHVLDKLNRYGNFLVWIRTHNFVLRFFFLLWDPIVHDIRIIYIYVSI